MSDLREIELETITGERLHMAEYAGKALLIVNVASKCGFTPQYAGLETLYRRYKDRGFAVLGFPCDQFGHQEPGCGSEIQDFTRASYDVTFPLFAKIDVNGAGTHPLFAHLKKAAPGLLGTAAIKWNFTKFLITPNGQVVARYAPTATPESIGKDIEAQLPQ